MQARGSRRFGGDDEDASWWCVASRRLELRARKVVKGVVHGWLSRCGCGGSAPLAGPMTVTWLSTILAGRCSEAVHRLDDCKDE